MARCSPSGAQLEPWRAENRSKRQREAGGGERRKRKARDLERAQGGGKARSGETAPRALGPSQRTPDQEPERQTNAHTSDTRRHPEQEPRREAATIPREPRDSEGPPPRPKARNDREGQ